MEEALLVPAPFPDAGRPLPTGCFILEAELTRVS